MTRLAAIATLATVLALAGCARRIDPPQVSVPGPRFSADQFVRAPRPLPPDRRAAAGPHGGRAALHYETRLGAWGERGWQQLESVGHALSVSGQVIDRAIGTEDK